MDFRKRIEEKREDLIADLQGCIRIPSVYAQDDSGYPYGKAVQDCLEYMRDTARKLEEKLRTTQELSLIHI